MKKFLVKLFSFLLLVYLLSWMVYGVLFLFERHYYRQSMKTRWVTELQNKHVEYIFLGSSRMANTIACHQLDSSLHCSSLNLATAGSSYGESYVLLKEFLNHGNKAKTLVLTLDLFKGRFSSPDKEAITPLVFKQFELFPLYGEKDVREVYADYSSRWRLLGWDCIPLFRYAEFNSYFTADNMFEYLKNGKEQVATFDTTNGEQMIYFFKFDGINRAAPEVIWMGPRGEKYLLKILDLAQKEKMKVVLLTAPYYLIDSFDRSKHQKFLSFLQKKYNARYLDFSNQKDWREKKYFSDPIHTNVLGSRLFTKYLSDSLR